MAVFFSSDIHFGHDNLRKFYPKTRGSFPSVEALDAHIIKEWNARIAPGDDVFILGDLGHGNPGHLDRCLAQLNGDKVLVVGNHDKKTWRNVKHHFVEVHQSYYEEWIGDKFVTMCHYPIWEWNSISRGAYHLHGHLHGKPHGIPGRILDVGIDNNNLLPFSFDDVVRFMEKREIRKHNV